ncbi:DMT family transporter [Deltaproteobacteria bacterium TL4]
MQRPQSTRRGLLLAGTAMFTAGLTAIPHRIALESIAPLNVVFGMFLCGLGYTLLGIFLQRIRLSFDPNLIFSILSIAILGVCGNYAICNALIGISPTLAITVQRSDIIIAMILSWIVLKERVTPRLWVGVGLASGGIVLMKKGSVSISMESWLPILWAVASAFCFAIMQIIIKKIVKRIDPQVLNAWRLAIALGILSFVPGQIETMQKMSSQEWRMILLAAFLGPFLSRITYTHALRHIPVSLAVLLSTFAPVSTLIAEYFFLGNLLTWYEALGSLFILVGIVWPLLPKRNDPLL